MAIFVATPTMVGAGATGGFNWKEFDLNQLVQQFESEEFYNNSNSTTYTYSIIVPTRNGSTSYVYSGETIEDVYSVTWDAQQFDYSFRTSFGGTALTFDGEGNPTGGLITFMSTVLDVGAGSFGKFWMADFSISASTVISAVYSSSKADDRALLKQILAGDDALHGSIYDDVLHGFGGNDILDGNDSHDILSGGGGNDILVGRQGDDKLVGGGGHDQLLGGRLSDKLLGGNGRDFLDGGDHNDKLTGGKGNDVIIGGSGYDTFIFRAGDGRDKIRDFTDDVDTLKLDDSLWGGGMTKAQVLAQYATDTGSQVVLEFDGGERITLVGFSNIDDLKNDLVFI